MSGENLKYKLKGNESFTVREGWLNKGITAILNNPYVFSASNAMDELGMGSKMVKSLKYWLLTTGLCEERRDKKSKHFLQLTSDLGEIIEEHDKYFEDVFTLWILHYNIVTKYETCTIWNLFFNCFNAEDFSKESLVNRMNNEFIIRFNNNNLIKSITDDCGVLLKMYVESEKNLEDPEDNLSSPFSELGLVQKNGKGKYRKEKPFKDNLDRLAVLYVMLSRLSDDKKGISIEDLVENKNNIGKVFNLDRNLVIDYMDQLRQEKYIVLNRTAGLDMVYFREDISPVDVLLDYYSEIERDD